MVCPCCGGEMASDGLSCACGARVVGPPLTEPDYVVPGIGRPVLALMLAVLSLAAIVWKWLLIVAVIGLCLAWGSIKRVKRDPRHYGGKRIAYSALTLAVLVILGVSTYVATGIPKFLRARAESQRAATRAQMYRVAIALHEYKQKHGAYPVSLNALQLELTEPMVLSDHWENSLKYQATTEVAADSLNNDSQSTVLASFNQYQLVSPGPDAKLGTADDLVLRDDVIVNPSKGSISADVESLEE